MGGAPLNTVAEGCAGCHLAAGCALSASCQCGWCQWPVHPAGGCRAGQRVGLLSRCRARSPVSAWWHVHRTGARRPVAEALGEALGEAAQTAAMAYRLVMTISDAVRRVTPENAPPAGRRSPARTWRRRRRAGRPASCAVTSATTPWPY